MCRRLLPPLQENATAIAYANVLAIVEECALSHPGGECEQPRARVDGREHTSAAMQSSMGVMLHAFLLTAGPLARPPEMWCRCLPGCRRPGCPAAVPCFADGGASQPPVTCCRGWQPFTAGERGGQPPSQPPAQPRFQPR